MPNSDKNKGPIDSLYEESLEKIIGDVVKKYHDQVRIWNISMGCPDQIVSDEMISDFGQFLDNISDQYNVQFFISAGNYVDKPYRSWPAKIVDDSDRITVPADSFRAITVGSLAEKWSFSSLAQEDQPSPFSRRGPGANFSIKPDLVDYGGNVNDDFSCRGLGVLGLDETGKISEDAGTSFSCPLVAYKFSKIFDRLAQDDLLEAKGLLIHESHMASHAFLVSGEDYKYFGFGKPEADCEDALLCSDNEITLIFKQKIEYGTHLDMDDFPYPKKLCRNGKYFGEIFMTLVSEPPLDPNFGSEYCRANFDVSFGTYSLKNGKRVFKGQVPPEKNWDEKYEIAMVEHGFKWNTIKCYHRLLKNGVDGADGWKIRVNMEERNRCSTSFGEFFLAITIRADENTPIYDDVLNDLKNRGYSPINLQTKGRIRGKN